MRLISLAAAFTVITGCADLTKQRSLDQLTKTGTTKPCYDRRTEPHTAVTDLHFHSQPFGGPSIPYEEQMSYLDRTGVRFVLLYGIGQQLPHDSSCTYYLDCIGTPAKPGIKNDFENAANYVEFPQDDIHVALSMTFPDLASPEGIVEGIRLLDDEYPGLFQWISCFGFRVGRFIGRYVLMYPVV